jgi:glycosyltransferase involved in cell wall biosynthesis
MDNPVIIYLSPFDLLRPRTNQVSDVRFCEGFAQNNCEVHLVVPFAYREDNIPKESVPQNYGLTTNFQIHYLPTNFKGDVSGLRKLMLTAWYGQTAIRNILESIPASKKVIIISRNGVLLLPYLTIKKTGNKRWNKIKVIHWLHDLKLKAKDKFIYRNCDGLLATNKSILNDLVQACDLKDKKFTYTLNPVTQAQVDDPLAKSEARQKTGLEHLKEPLIVYTGKLGLNYNKELFHILDAAKALPDCKFLITGGKSDAVSYWKKICAEKQISNVLFTGYIPDYTQIKNYQFAADILISYYTTQGHDPRYNLPNKICEYMLTGNAIVTPDYPATKDLLNAKNTFFALPENSASLIENISYILQNPGEAEKKGKQAKEDVKEFTFRKTGKRLIEFFNTL